VLNSVPTASESSGLKKSMVVKVTSLLVVIATLCIAFTAGANSARQLVTTDLALAGSLSSYDMALDVTSYEQDANDDEEEATDAYGKIKDLPAEERNARAEKKMKAAAMKAAIGEKKRAEAKKTMAEKQKAKADKKTTKTAAAGGVTSSFKEGKVLFKRAMQKLTAAMSAKNAAYGQDAPEDASDDDEKEEATDAYGQEADDDEEEEATDAYGKKKEKTAEEKKAKKDAKTATNAAKKTVENAKAGAAGVVADPLEEAKDLFESAMQKLTAAKSAKQVKKTA